MKPSFLFWAPNVNTPGFKAAAKELRARKQPYLAVVHMNEKPPRKTTVRSLHHFKVRSIRGLWVFILPDDDCLATHIMPMLTCDGLDVHKTAAAARAGAGGGVAGAHAGDPRPRAGGGPQGAGACACLEASNGMRTMASNFFFLPCCRP